MTAPELVVLLDDFGNPVGTSPKSEVHTADTPLHWAFSVYVFDPEGRLLVTRRSLSKITWPGVWSNSCCGHVRPGEQPAEAARRRVRSELGIALDELELVLPEFRYRATSAEGVVENELCPVFRAVTDQEPVPDPEEAMAWTWASWDSFVATATYSPWLISPWSAAQAVLMSPAAGG